MAVTTTNLMMGPVSIYVGAFGATEPANATVAPGTGWTDIGGTTDGATLTLGQTYTSLVADQIGMAAGAGVTEQTVTVATNLAEPTLANLRVAVNQATSAATTLEFGGEDIVNATPGYQAVLLKGKAPSGAPRLWIVRRTLSTEGIGIPFQKDGQTVIPITWTGYYVSASIRAVKIDETPGS